MSRCSIAIRITSTLHVYFSPSISLSYSRDDILITPRKGLANNNSIKIHQNMNIGSNQV
ncbi:hypothetical protein BH23THE1_BH23THE1_33210 [soil metagenome]